MNILFSALSAAYIAGIFLFADSPMVSHVTPFNPYSLLHIPLYAMLTFLLIVSFSPQRKRFLNPTNSTNPTNSINSSDSRNLRIAGIIALVVAIADEIHQAYIPNRNASIIDVLLDMIGIGLCVLVARRFRFMSALRNSGPPKRLS
jgi:hypothetical protein